MSHWIDAKFWLDDDDATHVWMRHRCVDGERTTMLPWPQWMARNGRIEPSVICDECDLHVMGFLDDEAPRDWLVGSDTTGEQT